MLFSMQQWNTLLRQNWKGKKIRVLNLNFGGNPWNYFVCDNACVFAVRWRTVMYSILAFMHAVAWGDYSLTSCLPNFIVKLKLVLPLIKVKMKNRLFYFAHTKLLNYGKSHVVAWCKFFQDWDCSPHSCWRHVFRLSSQPQKKKIPFLFGFWLGFLFCFFVVCLFRWGLEPTSLFAL